MPLPVTYDAYANNNVIPHSIASDLYEQTFGILGFGPAGSGTRSDTATFFKALAHLGKIGDSGKPVALYLPDGMEFLVDLDVLPAPNMLRVWGGGRLIANSIPGDAESAAFFTGGNCTGFSIRGIEVAGPDDKAVLLRLYSSSAIKVVGCELTDARILEANTDLAYADADTGVNGNACRDITVSGNRASRTAANLTNKAAVLLNYTVGGVVDDNRIDGFGYGLQFWGGDANPNNDPVTGDPQGDGALANERKVKNLTFTGNTVTNIADALGGGAGIWGSMGQHITVTGNTVDTCADVGIDFEGCNVAVATGNTVIDCPNGCFTTFSWNRGVIFSGNTGIQHTNGAVMCRIQNNSATTDNKRVTFSGNDFSCEGGIAHLLVETIEHAIVKGNTMHNVRIETEINNQRWTVITNNDMSFDVVAGAAFNAINVGRNHINGRVKIKANTIGSFVTQPAGTRAIRSYQDDPNNPVIVTIDDNECINMGLEPIEVIWNGANPAFIGYQRLRRNNLGLPTAVILVTEIGAAASNVVVEGNHDDINVPWP